MAPPDDVLAWRPFDEAAGPVASDIAGSKPAVRFGSPIAAPGKVGGSLRFGGSTDFAGAGDSDRWAFGAGGFTIELWANFDQPGHGNIFRAGDIFIGNDDGPAFRALTPVRTRPVRSIASRSRCSVCAPTRCCGHVDGDRLRVALAKAVARVTPRQVDRSGTCCLR